MSTKAPSYRPAGYKSPDYNRTRNTDHATQAWKEYSERYRLAHPLCVDCLARGLVKPSRLVDHIRPVKGPGDPLFWDATNHQALCWACHNRKTHADTKAGKNRRRG